MVYRVHTRKLAGYILSVNVVHVDATGVEHGYSDDDNDSQAISSHSRTTSAESLRSPFVGCQANEQAPDAPAVQLARPTSDLRSVQRITMVVSLITHSATNTLP